MCIHANSCVLLFAVVCFLLAGVCQFCETAKRLGVPQPVSIQNDFSPVLRAFEGELAEACAPSHYNIGLLAYGVLAGAAVCGDQTLLNAAVVSD
jgi:aryl-alcohol dehydrogenase-like predicted oxidoreductase